MHSYLLIGLPLLLLLPLQVYLCRRLRILRYLPIGILALTAGVLAFLAWTHTEWMALGYGIAAGYVVYLLGLCILGWVVWFFWGRK